jgi:hypothetical protein
MLSVFDTSEKCIYDDCNGCSRKKTGPTAKEHTIIVSTALAAKDSISRQGSVRGNSADVELVGKTGADYALQGIVCMENVIL